MTVIFLKEEGEKNLLNLQATVFDQLRGKAFILHPGSVVRWHLSLAIDPSSAPFNPGVMVIAGGDESIRRWQDTLCVSEGVNGWGVVGGTPTHTLTHSSGVSPFSSLSSEAI